MHMTPEWLTEQLPWRYTRIFNHDVMHVFAVVVADDDSNQEPVFHLLYDCDLRPIVLWHKLINCNRVRHLVLYKPNIPKSGKYGVLHFLIVHDRPRTRMFREIQVPPIIPRVGTVAYVQ